MLEIVILILLLYGCYTDIRWLHVDNKVSYSIALFGILMFNPLMLEVKALFIVFLLMAYQIKRMGSADVIVSIPLILMMTPLSLVVFMLSVCIVGIIIGMAVKEVPGFIPITIGFILATFVV